MSTVKGLFCAGDASGASSHKFSSGSHAEGRIAAKAAVKFVVENNTLPAVDAAMLESSESGNPAASGYLRRAQERHHRSGDQSQLPQAPHVHVPSAEDHGRVRGWITAQFITNGALLKKALELLGMLREDSQKLAASNLHELMRCWENTQQYVICQR